MVNQATIGKETSSHKRLNIFLDKRFSDRTLINVPKFEKLAINNASRKITNFLKTKNKQKKTKSIKKGGKNKTLKDKKF